MTEADEFAPRVGAVALAQAEIDEWLVQVLIALLRPLTPARVALIVGGRSLGEKVDLIKCLAKEMGLDFEQPLPGGVVPKKLLGQVRQLDSERNRAVHSYYDRRDRESARQFRSRRGEAEAIQISDLETLAAKQKQCLLDLNQFVEVLEQVACEQDLYGTAWSEVVRGVHEVIVAGHLVERGLLAEVAASFGRSEPVRLALRGVHRRVLNDGELPAEDEFSAVISPANWGAEITSPTGETITFGDSGWRDITTIAQEDDPNVEWAAIRRVGDTVQCSFEGGEAATAPWPQPRNRLAERAFGPQPDPGLVVPTWVRGLEGFGPSDNG